MTDLNSPMLECGPYDLFNSMGFKAGRPPGGAQAGMQCSNGTTCTGIGHIRGPVVLQGALGLLRCVRPWACTIEINTMSKHTCTVLQTQAGTDVRLTFEFACVDVHSEGIVSNSAGLALAKQEPKFGFPPPFPPYLP